ncbi:hypothetical protein [Actinoplanes solisilvae]|uniref:hypothetical protein n=1 Tax=Actinoplanes solisilvae TaxID=2486853 RepID=UPI000FD76EB1|nr:hypothetical protein [Actinoplanes solisilvae]
MNCRPRGGKPAVALWMLVAVIDLVLLAAAVGVLVSLLIVVAVLTVLAGGMVATRLLTKREPVARRRV